MAKRPPNYNVNPEYATPEVVLAREIYNEQYAAQNGGQVDFWEKLTREQKAFAREELQRRAHDSR
jgi:hypothetical protein